MKSALCAALLLLFVQLSVAENSYKNFRIPDHQVHALWATADLNHNFQNRYGLGVNKNSYGNARASFRGYWLRDHEDCALEFSPRLEYYGSLQERKSNGAYWDPTFREGSKSSQGQQILDVPIRAIFFPTDSPLGFEATLIENVSVEQYWYHYDYRYGDPDFMRGNVHDRERHTIVYHSEADLGIGWGRLRNASGVFQARVLEQRLQELGRLRGNLSDDTKLKLAQLYYRQSDFWVAHERSGKFFMSEVEQLLKADPAFSGELDAYATYRITEEIAPGYLSRWKGIRWSLNLRALSVQNVRHETDKHFQFEGTDSTWNVNSLNDYTYSGSVTSTSLLAGPRMQLACPLNWNWQLSADSRFEHRFDPTDAGFAWTNNFQIEYAMADRWLLRYELDHVRYILDPLSRDLEHRNAWYVENSARLGYYVTDRISASCNLSLAQSKLRSYIPNNELIYIEQDYSTYWDSYYQREASISLSLTYHFSGHVGPYDGAYYQPRDPYTAPTDHYPYHNSFYYQE
ncbi:MAG: hypothetical protein H6508_00500 [Calditrichaeota bacterium]|nr:hypothetical protein [Calditrichota bacterium]MCB9365653.1 hypothetical protein [Calditrichota bacterium]